MSKKKNPHIGSSWDDFMENDISVDEKIAIKAAALKYYLAEKARKEMKKQGIGTRKLGTMMKTSPAQIERILDGEYTGVSLKNLVKLYDALGKDLKVTVK